MRHIKDFAPKRAFLPGRCCLGRWGTRLPVSEALLEKCTAAARAGADFPTIWHSILKASPLVRRKPVQVAPERLEIALITGESLVFETATKHFRLD